MGMRRSLSVSHSLTLPPINRQRPRGRVLPLKLLRLYIPGLRHLLAQGRIMHHPVHGLGPGIHLIGIQQKARHADDFGQGTPVAGDDGTALVHGFQRRQAKPFVMGGQSEKGRGRVQPRQLLITHPLQMADMRPQTQFLYRGENLFVQPPLATHENQGNVGEARPQVGIRLEQRGDVFARFQCAHKEQKPSRQVVLGQDRLDLGRGNGSFIHRIGRQVDGGHFFRVYVEPFQQVAPRVVAIGGDVIRLLHRPADLLQVVAAALGGQVVGVVEEIQVVDGDDVLFGPPGRGDKVGGVEQGEAVRPQLCPQRPFFPLVVARCPKITPPKVRRIRDMRLGILATLENGILVGLIQFCQGRDEVQNVLANPPHPVKRQPTINSDVHGVGLYLTR